MHTPAAPASKLTQEAFGDLLASTFRAVVRRGIVLGSALHAIHGGVLAWGGSSAWTWSVAAIVAVVPPYWMMGARRAYPVYVLGILLFFLVTLVYTTSLARRFGPAPLFHLLLLSVSFAVMVNARIPTRSKWALSLSMGAGLLWLDAQLRIAGGAEALPPGVLELLRNLNLGAIFVLIAALSKRYFDVMARIQAELEARAFVDPLTGLVNRRRLYEAAANEIARSRRHGQPLSLLLADIDHFKSINDTYGHDQGDDVLREIGHRLQESARATDVVCRWGGEEFLMLLPQTGLEGALIIGERTRALVADSPVAVQDGRLGVTLTMGVAQVRSGEVLDDALRRADAALYAGKGAGRDRVVGETAS